MPVLEAVVDGRTLPVDLPAGAKVKDLMTVIAEKGDIEIGKQVLLYKCLELRMPPYEKGMLVVYDGDERTVSEDRALAELNIDSSDQLVCGELVEEWLEDVKWGAFGQTLYEADYENHREYVIFN
eukprot:CAMPEP_0195067436 /NCGR_PEP_ID=MMETSP0448-20130528/12496_1 /TAXON_ID=66468 /ORGANISM="Heterocapsa triquestra, Strain CCMP 448" /LENGTH=124 /DNA_ID=CAMNT_0040098851 /DNA_START=51 /DNA_END=422 /DNA_ORIENTATION=-